MLLHLYPIFMRIYIFEDVRFEGIFIRLETVKTILLLSLSKTLFLLGVEQKNGCIEQRFSLVFLPKMGVHRTAGNPSG